MWVLGAFATGGLWYVRNLAVTGNPLPWLRSIGPIDLPSPDQAFGLRPDFAVVHYLGNGDVWSDRFLPGLHVELGDLWPLLLALALAGMVTSIVRPAVPVVRVLGLAALAGAVAYAYTPLSAAGPEDDPVAFATNLRWLAPFLALGVALLPLLPLRARRLPGILLAVALLAIGAVNLDLSSWADDANLLPALAIALGLVGAGLGAIAIARSRLPGVVAVAAACVAAVVFAAVYSPEAGDYLGNRFRSGPPGSELGAAFDWARSVRGARIAARRHQQSPWTSIRSTASTSRTTWCTSVAADPTGPFARSRVVSRGAWRSTRSRSTFSSPRPTSMRARRARRARRRRDAGRGRARAR